MLRLFRSILPCTASLDRDLKQVLSLAPAYTVGIVRNHPYVDGNKRTGLVIGILFLELNGYRFMASEEDAAQAIISLAEGTLDEGSLVAFLRTNVVHEA
ncbi:MAG: type II toxin-antitoxin system death-on-curing family toxin [Methylococcales bacterium]